MFKNTRFELFIQLSIIAVCLLILTFKASNISCQAQVLCDGEPRIIDGDPVYSPQFGDPKRWTWAPGTTVNVLVFDTPDNDDLKLISDGIREWNAISMQTCSGVTFNEAIRADHPWEGESEILPNNTLAVVRANPTQAFRTQSRNPGLPNQSLMAARIQLSPAYNKNNPSFDPNRPYLYNNSMKGLATHETGHTFNIANEGYWTNTFAISGRSIYGKTDFITQCDIEAHRRIYCPFYARPPAISPGSFPISLNQQTGAQTTETHGMFISNYNDATGTFTLRIRDYSSSRPNYQSTMTNYPASSPPSIVVDNTDPCFNSNGTVKNLTIIGSATPIFGCNFTKQIALNPVGTENYTPTVGNGGAFVKVYTGTTTPGSGVPYMHFIYHQTSPINYYHYAANTP
jgi:hypothetical protein